jgi:malate dehydrogenase (oxaloacetate-decarboxylating)
MIDHIKVILCGVGAAGIAICKLLLKHGVKNIIMSDTKGAIYNGRE